FYGSMVTEFPFQGSLGFFTRRDVENVDGSPSVGRREKYLMPAPRLRIEELELRGRPGLEKFLKPNLEIRALPIGKSPPYGFPVIAFPGFLQVIFAVLVDMEEF